MNARHDRPRAIRPAPRSAPRALGWIFACGLLASACAGGQTAAAPAALELDAANVATSAEGILTAGQISEADLEKLAASGYVAVINLRAPGESGNWDAAPRAQELGVEYISLPIEGSQGIDFAAARQLDELLDRLAPSPEAPVALHCGSSNRVGALIALRAALDGATASEALDLGRAAGLTSLEPRVTELLAAPPQ